jgi:hypothetical protein
MKFDWRLFPLQRKLEWDLEIAQGRLARQQRAVSDLARVLRELQATRDEQSAAASAATQRRADPFAHRQALAYLAGLEARLARARAHRSQAESQMEDFRVHCQRCNERLEALKALYQQAHVRFTHAAQREAEKEADFAWLTSAARGAGE